MTWRIAVPPLTAVLICADDEPTPVAWVVEDTAGIMHTWGRGLVRLGLKPLRVTEMPSPLAQGRSETVRAAMAAAAAEARRLAPCRMRPAPGTAGGDAQ